MKGQLIKKEDQWFVRRISADEGIRFSVDYPLLPESTKKFKITLEENVEVNFYVVEESDNDIYAKIVDPSLEILGHRILEKKSKRSEGEVPGSVAGSMSQIALSLSEKCFSVKYKGDIADLGNEIGFVVGKVVKDMTEGEIVDFIHGLRHGISLTNGTH